MKRAALVLMVLSAATRGIEADPPESGQIWPLVAKSHIIATGVLDAPVEQIRSSLANNRPRYVELAVTTDQLLKGSAPSRFLVRWYTETRDYAPSPERVINHDGKKALFFLLDLEDSPAGDFYFAGRTSRALSNPDATLLQCVQREVQKQEKLLTQFQEFFPLKEESLYEQVKKLIDMTTQRDTQMDAFRQLEELGPEAVPAIIMLMDDRRDLAVPEISLRNPPGHWEAVRHYSPEKVVDAMDAILNRITGQSFGNVPSGGTESERREAVNGWRTYLYYWKKARYDY